MLGPMKFSSLRIFAGSVYQRLVFACYHLLFISHKFNPYLFMSSRSGLSSKDSEGDNSVTAKAQATVDVINSQADWSASCPSSMLGICVIGFLNAPASASQKESFSIDPAQMETLTSAMQLVQKDTPVFHFAAGNIACLSEFGQQFGVDPFNTPSIVIYSPGKDRFAVHKGSFNEVI